MEKKDDTFMYRKEWELRDCIGKKYGFHYVGPFNNGFARVVINGKGENFVSSEGNLLSEKWFDKAENFSEGFACIFDEDRGRNYISAEGKLLSNEWFDYANKFSEGFAGIYKKGKCNYISSEGKYLFNEWRPYDSYKFIGGFALIKEGDKCNFVSKEGNLLSLNWFDDAYSFSEGFARIKLDFYCWNFISKEGNLLYKKNFMAADDFKEGYACILLEKKGYNYINGNCKFLSEKWYDGGYSFYNGLALIYEKRIKWYNFIKKNKYSFYEIPIKYNFISKEGKLLHNEWIFQDSLAFPDELHCYVRKEEIFHEDFEITSRRKFNGGSKEKEYNYILKDGEFLSEEWFDKAENFSEGFAFVMKDGKEFYINHKGKQAFYFN